MRYMVDTNIISDLIKHPCGKAAERVRNLPPNSICTTTIVAGELRYGIIKRASANLRSRVEKILREIPVLPLDAACADIYGKVRTELERKGLSIGTNDLWIAAHALASNKILVTHNVKEFSRVENLNMENWLE